MRAWKNEPALFYNAPSKIKPAINCQGKATSGTGDHGLITLKPLSSGVGNCIDDNQQMEILIHSATISAIVDRPLNTNQQRF